jgi:tetratricopeptide (TPR) repeat protein
LSEEYEKGLNALKEKNFEKSKEIFSKIIENKPESGISHLGLGFSLLELQEVDEAEKHLKASVSLFEAQRKLPEAYVSINTMLKIKPHILEYTFDLLRIFLKLDFLKSFAELLLKIMKEEKLTEDMFKGNISSMASFVKNENLKKILKSKAGGTTKEEDKLNPFENYELANLLFEIGSTEEAKVEYYKTARAFLNRDLKNKSQELYVKIKELYPEDEGLASLKKDIDNYGKEEESMSLKERREKIEEILPSLENESEARVKYSAAIIYKEYARFDDAKNELESILSLPKCEEKVKTYVLLSQIFMDDKDSDKAIEILEEVMGGDEFSGSELVPLKYKLGTIYERTGRLEEALEVYAKANEENPDYLDLVEKVKIVEKKIEEKKAREIADKEREGIAEPEVKEEIVEEKETEEIEKEGDEEVKKEKKKVKKKAMVRERIFYI